MPLLVPTVGENKLLEFAVGLSTPGDQVLRLFTNNITPADGDTVATYTEMAAFGYASKTLAKGSWSIVQNSGVAEASYPQQVWTFSGSGSPVTIYGYYVVDSTTGVLLWAERFNVVKVIQLAGDQLYLTPRITLSKV